MLNLTVSGMVLRVQPSGDNDRLCTILTDKHGVISAYARGARNMKNKNCTGTAQFVYGNFELYRRKEYYIVDESQYEQLYAGLREDIVRLTVAQYLCQLAIEIVPEEQAAEDYLVVMRAALYYLSENTRPPLLVKAAAEMRMLTVAGYMPDLVMCPECGAYEADLMYFIPRTGQIKCGNCGMGFKEYGVELGRGAMTAMRHSIYADVNKLFAFSLNEHSMNQFYRAAESFVLARLDKSLTTLEFLRSIL